MKKNSKHQEEKKVFFKKTVFRRRFVRTIFQIKKHMMGVIKSNFLKKVERRIFSKHEEITTKWDLDNVLLQKYFFGEKMFSKKRRKQEIFYKVQKTQKNLVWIKKVFLPRKEVNLSCSNEHDWKN